MEVDGDHVTKFQMWKVRNFVGEGSFSSTRQVDAKCMAASFAWLFKNILWSLKKIIATIFISYYRMNQ